MSTLSNATTIIFRLTTKAQLGNEKNHYAPPSWIFLVIMLQQERYSNCKQSSIYHGRISNFEMG